MNDVPELEGMDPESREAVRDLVRAEDRSNAHRDRWRRLLDSRTAIVVLVALAVLSTVYTVLDNRRAIDRNSDQARANAAGTLAAEQLVCNLERDTLRIANHRLSTVQVAILLEYDREAHCSDVLRQPHAPLVIPAAKPPKPKSGTASVASPQPPTPGVPTPSFASRAAVQPQPSSPPPPTPTHSSSPSPAPTRHPPSHRPSSSPTPCIHNPISGKCLL